MCLRHCVSPFLFFLHTKDFSYQTEACHLQKFSDDSAVVGCISKGEQAECRAVVDNFVTWCELNHLQLNTAKTKELVVDLWRTRTPVTPVSILGHNVDIVEHCKYLGVVKQRSTFSQRLIALKCCCVSRSAEL